MISAVVPPQPRPLPPVPPIDLSAVRSRAAAGYFRDIALWLNQPLAPHGIFVQVQADRPGCLRLVVEFEQPPIKDHLLRLLCHQIWLLNSELIEGICVVARPLCHRRTLWQQRIKISTPALKQRRARLATQTQAGRSPLPPRIQQSRRPKPTQSNQGLSRQRLQSLRAFVLSGSAVAAFVMGCLLEAILSGAAPTLPQLQAQSEVQPLGRSDQSAAGQSGQGVTAFATAPAAPAEVVVNRPTVVDAALEPVGVLTHQKATAAPSGNVTLLFGGDIALDDVAPEALTAPGGFFAEVADYSQADLALVNLATPLASAATSLQEELRQQNRTEAVDLLVNSGVDIVNLTHSRLMDYCAAGLEETLTTLDSRGVFRIGAGRNALEARRPEVLDVKGKRIAYLSYAMGGNDAAHDDDILKERAGANDQAIAKEVETFKTAVAFKERAGFNAQNMPEIVADIQALRPEVDWIVVNFRWVEHLTEQPNFMQTNLARLAIDQGADVVVGYHPSVIQGGEIYKGRPIAYSLGDFVFRPDEPIENQDSAVLKVALKYDQMRVELVPVQVRDSRPKTLTGPASRAVLQRIEQASSQFDKPLKSPVVLDLKAPEVPPETVSDPGGAFVSPNDTDIVPVEPETRPEAVSPPAMGNPADQPVVPAGAAPLSDVSEPGVLPDLEIEFDADLQDWGTKVSPQQKEFKPVPPQRQGGVDHDLRSEAVPDSPRQHLYAELPEPHLWGEALEADLLEGKTLGGEALGDEALGDEALESEAPGQEALGREELAVLPPQNDVFEPSDWADVLPPSPVATAVN
jgi:poly-gamma-glutamate capsule biosynthesis protein CapA/YwtB (metallophosphatase superfamily)